MIIELGDNGLRDRYWWSTHNIEGIDDPAQAAYRAIRRKCEWLTDDNHEWEAVDYGPCKPEHLKLKQFTQSSRYLIKIYAVKNGKRFNIRGIESGFWFHTCYRVPGQEF
jgi:hypothetical protein